MRKILYVASEAVPFAKTGGLADVAGSLPAALKKQGCDIRVVMPKYGMIPDEYKRKMKHVTSLEIPVAWRKKYLGIEKLVLNDVTFYFLDNEEYFKREGLYGYGDDAERFAFFSEAVLQMLPAIGFWPEIIHANDWHAALVSVFLKLHHMGDERYAGIKTIFTIHNLKYQGVFPDTVMEDVLGLSRKYFDNGDLEFYGAVNFMKGGLIYSDLITTVSESYAQEIQYPYFGEKLDGLLRSRKNVLSGILNGIDYDFYNPSKDTNIFETFDADSIDRKIDNKIALQRYLGLPEERNVPALALVSRLVQPKGLDLIVRVMDEILQYENVQLIVLGSGDKNYEDWFKGLAWRFPSKVSANIKFSHELAQKIYAAADIFLMPSNYEPCGIGQMIAMRYGTIPVVRATGGLRDTVKPYDKNTGEGTGFVFENYNAHDFMYAVKKAISAYGDINVRQRIIKNAMTADFSWTHSAKEYSRLYDRVLGK